MPCSVLLFLGPFLFATVFGAKWEQAGTSASLLSHYLATQFFASPVTSVLSVVGREAHFLQVNVVRTLIVFAAFGASYVFALDAFATVGLFSLASAGHRLFVYWRVMHVLRVAIREGDAAT